MRLAWLRIISGLLLVFSEFCTLSYLQQIALRLPEPEWARRFGFLKWAMAVSYCFLFVSTVTMAASMVAVGEGTSTAGLPARFAVAGSFTLLVLPASIAIVIVTLLLLELLYRMATSVRGQVPLALDNWRCATGTTPVAAATASPEVAAEIIGSASDLRGELAPSLAARSATPEPETAQVAPLKVAHLAAPLPNDAPASGQ